MLQILQSTFDASGAMQRCEALPFLFPDRDAAVLFLDCHLDNEFASGRSGYESNDDSWWACDHTQEIAMHRYRISGWTS